MRPLLACLEKDFKTLFRNWTSLLIAVIGPLCIMFLLMASFSDLGFNNIQIGHVVGADDQYAFLWPYLSYVGTFIPYTTLGECHTDLRAQILHLCLKPEGKVLQAYFDNTRELISLILLNQVRAAVNEQREALVRESTQGVLGEVQATASFLETSEGQVDRLGSELQTQKHELSQTQNDVRSARDTVDDQIDRLTDLRSDVIETRNRASTRSSEGFTNADSKLNQAQNAVDAAQSQIPPPGGDALLPVEESIQETRSELYETKREVDTEIAQMDEVVRDIDDALSSLEQSRQLLSDNDNRIRGAVLRLDERSSDLNSWRTSLSQRGDKLEKLSAKQADELLTPITLGFLPLFSGSERLRSRAFDVSLSDQQKQRLLNFGTVQTFLPFVIILLICFVSTLLSNILLLDELHSPAFLRNQLLPSSGLTSFISLLLTVLSVTTVQVLLILGIGYFIFYLDFVDSLGTIALVSFLLIATYSILGMIIAYVVRVKTTSLLVSAFFLMSNLILGGVIYPVERMAPIMSSIAQLIPFSSGISMLQQSIFYGVPLSVLLGRLVAMVCLFVIFGGLLIIARWNYLRSYVRGA